MSHTQGEQDNPEDAHDVIYLWAITIVVTSRPVTGDEVGDGLSQPRSQRRCCCWFSLLHLLRSKASN